MDLEIKHLSKQYEKKRCFANKDITCTFPASQLTALIGHNGAGKTTLLNQIIGLVKPTSGQVLFENQSLTINPDDARMKVSMMPQLHAPLKGVSIRQAVRAIGKIRGLLGSELEEQVSHILDALDIRKWENKSGDYLSGGLKRLTSFAMAVIAPPPILLLDEPTNDVDPIRRKLLWSYLQGLTARGHIVVVVTHNILEVEQYADCFYLLEQGQIKAAGSVKKLSNQAKIKISFLPQNLHVLMDFPLSFIHKEDGQIEVRVDKGEVPQVLTWMTKKIETGEISHYSITTVTLNDQYEEMNDDQ